MIFNLEVNHTQTKDVTNTRSLLSHHMKSLIVQRASATVLCSELQLAMSLCSPQQSHGLLSQHYDIFCAALPTRGNLLTTFSSWFGLRKSVDRAETRPLQR